MIDKAISKIDLLLEDLKKDIEHYEETGRSWFNEELLCIRLKEIKKMLGDNNA